MYPLLPSVSGTIAKAQGNKDGPIVDKTISVFESIRWTKG
jgi:hypothetical protein